MLSDQSGYLIQPWSRGSTEEVHPFLPVLDPGPFLYMNKIAVGPEARGVIDIEKPITDNLKAIAKAKSKNLDDLTCVILDRSRHDEMVAEMRRAGVRIRLIPDGDVAGALMTSWGDSGIDALFGIGGTPEGVITACALRAMGGEIQGKLYARNEDEKRRGEEQVLDMFRHVEAPALSIMATRDERYITSAQLQARLAAMVNARQEEVDGGHHVHMEKPELIGGMIRDFIVEFDDPAMALNFR